MIISHWLTSLKLLFGRARGPWVSRRAMSRRRGFCTSLEALEDRCVLSFNPILSYPVDTSPAAIAVADFNGDNLLDLVTANSGSSTVSVLLGREDGTFQAAGDFATGANPRSVAVGDFNSDGKLDVATANYGGTDLSVLFGNGDGTLGGPLSIPLPTPVPTIVDPPLAVAVGDFNADGKLDLVATSQDSYTYFWGGGGGGGYGYGYYGGGGSYTNYRGYVHVILGHGDGSFQAPNTYELASGFPMAVAVADFNTDGKLDVVTANRDWGTVSVLLGNGDGTLQYNSYTDDYAASWSGNAVTVGDFTGDGILDIATAGLTVDILPGLGDGTFQPVLRQYIDPASLAAADFNGDGHLDVVTAEPSTGMVSVLLGTGNGTLTLPINLAAGSLPTAVAVEDFNGDGRPDVAVANAGSSDVSILFNDGAWPALNAPSLSINDVTVIEGHAGTVNASFTVTLSAAYSQDVTVRYTTGDVSWTSATAGSDYEAQMGQFTIPVGQTSATINVPIYGDRIGESTELFVVHLTDVVNVFIADGQGVANIVDDEPQITIDSYASAVEGNTGTTAIEFKVRLSTASDEEVRVNFSTAEGDTHWWAWSGYYYYYGAAATSGIDFAAQAGTLIFAPGETEKTISILAYGDRVAEPDEAFLVNLSDPVGAGIYGGQAEGWILDDEPFVSIIGTTLIEGSTGTTQAQFTVTLSAASDAPITVDYTTGNASATAGLDYQAAAGTLIFEPGETTKTITILVNGDQLAEYTEEFLVYLTGATGVHLSYGQAIATIVDDDAHVSISDVSLQEGDSGVTYFTFLVSLSAASDSEVTVSYQTESWWDAAAGSDYEAQTGTVVFAPGETSKSIRIAVYGDTSKEADESFYIYLSEVMGNAVLDEYYGMGTILNDDADPGKGNSNGKGGKKK